MIDDTSNKEEQPNTGAAPSRRIGAGTIILMLVFVGIIAAMCVGSVMIFIVIGLR